MRLRAGRRYGEGYGGLHFAIEAGTYAVRGEGYEKKLVEVFCIKWDGLKCCKNRPKM